MSTEVTSEYLRLVESFAEACREAEKQVSNLAGTLSKLQGSLKNTSQPIDVFNTAVKGFRTGIEKAEKSNTEYAFSFEKLTGEASSMIQILKSSTTTFQSTTSTFSALNQVGLNANSTFSNYTRTVVALGNNLGDASEPTEKFTGILKKTSKETDILDSITKGFTSGLIDLGITLAGMALTAVIDHFTKLWEREKDLQKATQNLSDTFPSIQSGFDDAGTKASNASGGFATFKKHVDDLIKSHGELIESFKETYQGIEEDSVIVSHYMKTIEELTAAETLHKNGGKLLAEQQVELQQVVYGLNKICGMNIEITDLTTGSLSMSTEAIKLNTEAWLNNAEQQALQEQVFETYKLQTEYQRKLELATLELVEAKKLEAEAYSISKDEGYVAHEYTKIAQAEVDRLTKAYDASTAQLISYSNEMANINSTFENSGSTIYAYISSMADVSDSLKEAEVNIEGFALHLSELGYKTEDIKAISKKNLGEMALSWSDSSRCMLETAREYGVMIPNTVAAGLESGNAQLYEAMSILAYAGINDPASLIPGFMSMRIEEAIVVMRNLLIEGGPKLEESTETIVNVINRAMSGMVDVVRAPTIDAMNALVEELEHTQKVKDAAAVVRDCIANTLSNFSMRPIGVNCTESLADGIGDSTAMRFLTLKAEAVMQAAIDAAKNKADSHSPSRVMIKQGKDFNAGIALGIEESTEKVVLSTNDMMDEVIEKVTRSKANLSLDLFGKQSKAMSNTVMPQGTVVNIGDVTYTPDSRIAELMAELFNILVRNQHMRPLAVR